MHIRGLIPIAALAAWLGATQPLSADPLHARDNGDFWHHDSGWIFPSAIGAFTRVGVPQDVAGTTDAVAYYAWDVDGRRIVASVDVVAADSAAEQASLESARWALLGENGAANEAVDGHLPVAQGGALEAVRVTTRERSLYFVDAGAWRVRILFTTPPAKPSEAAQFDAFVRGQRWDTLPR